jgi:autoinducer 2 (AI-2) kinase
MSRNYLLSYDVGGGSGRCLLIDPANGEITTAKRVWTHPVAPGTNGLGFNLDIGDILVKLADATTEVLSKAKVAPRDIAGISAASMRNTTVILDKNHNVLMGTPNRDARAIEEGLIFGLERGKEVHAISGHWPSPLFLGTRLLWMKSKMPDILRKAVAALSLSDWLSFWLSGSIAAEKSQAGETLLFDHIKGLWAFDLIESLGLPHNIFPETVPAGVPLGKLTDEAARILGLASGTPVSTAGADTQCALLGAGVIDDGDLAVIAGTTMPIQLVTGKYILDSAGRLWSGQHVVPGRFVLESNGMTTGEVLDWFSRALYFDCSNSIQALFADAAKSVPGASGIYSTSGVTIFDGRSIGIPVGNISLSHMVTKDAAQGRRHIARALIEGIAYSVRANIQQLVDVSGYSIRKIHVVGGMSRNRLFSGIISDVTGLTVVVPWVTEITALGASILAGTGSGIFSDPVEGAVRIAKTTQKYSSSENSVKYQSLYNGWCEAHKKRSEADVHISNLLTTALFESAPLETATADATFRPKILVTSSMDEFALKKLRSIGDVTYAGWRESMKVYDGANEFIYALEGYHVLITEMDVVDFETIKGAEHLKVIITCRGNAVNVDLTAATAFGIPVINTPGRNADAVADLTIALMIMLARKMPLSADFLKRGGIKAGDMGKMAEAYLSYRGYELWRKTVGLIGFGNVGMRVAKRLKPFETRVLFFDPAVAAEEGVLLSAEKTSLESLLSESDFISLHASDTESTKGMMNQHTFGMMKKGVFFINTARAALVNDDALYEALQSGTLAGAALDVFSVEPPASDDRIISHPNVIATPHLGGNTQEIASHQSVTVMEQLNKLLTRRTCDYILNSEVLSTFSISGPRRKPDDPELKRLSLNQRPSMTS